jgi:hypothetical protein
MKKPSDYFFDLLGLSLLIIVQFLFILKAVNK